MRFLFLEVSQYLFDNERVFNTGNDLNLSASTLSGFNVDIENPFQSLHPGYRYVPLRWGFI
jgi:hypothetical protein